MVLDFEHVCRHHKLNVGEPSPGLSPNRAIDIARQSQSLSREPSLRALSCIFVGCAVFEFALLYLNSSSFRQHADGHLRRSEPLSNR
jgi:hypothetical protein